MNILNKLTLQSLKLNKKRTVVTIIGIILSCAMIFGVAAITASFQDFFVRSAIKYDGNFHASLFDVPVENIKYIEENAYTDITMLSRDGGQALSEHLPDERRPYLFIKEYDATAMEHMPITLREGRFPEKAGEMVISEDIRPGDEKDYHIGRTLTLDIGKRVDEDGEPLTHNHQYDETTEVFISDGTETYTITGFIERPRFHPRVAGYTAVTYLDHNKLTGADSVNISFLAQNPRHIYDRVPEMADNAGAGGYTYNNELLRYLGVSRNDNANIFLHSVSLIIILLIVIGSVAVIYNAFAISVSERKKQFGMLTSVGATPKQIRRTVYFEGFILGLIGIPLGILSGYIGIGVTMSIVSDLMNFGSVSLRMVVPPAVIIITVVFVILVIFLSAYIPSGRAAKISPIEAIRMTTDINIKSKKLRTSKITRLLFGVEGELALKNLKRIRRRYRTTVFSLFISIVLFISFSSFMKYGIQSGSMYYEERPYNLVVSHYELPYDEQKELYEQIASYEGIERHAVLSSINSFAKLKSEQLGADYRDIHIRQAELYEKDKIDDGYRVHFNIIAPCENEFKAYANENGLEYAGFTDAGKMKGILVNKAIMRNGMLAEHEPLHIETGEEIPFSAFNYEGEGMSEVFSLEIGAVTDSLPFGASFDQNMRYSEGMSYSVVYLIVSEEVLSEISFQSQELYKVDDDNPEFVEEIRDVRQFDHRLYIEAEDSTKLVEELRQSGTLLEGAGIQDLNAANEEMARTSLAMSIFLYGFVALITLIGVTNIFNTISTNVALRRREFAMLKSVGLTPRGFNKMINYESIFYGLKALLYGLPVSIAISYLLYRAFGSMFVFSFTLPWREISFCIAGVMIIVFITMLHSSAKLKKENIIDALKEENL